MGWDGKLDSGKYRAPYGANKKDFERDGYLLLQKLLTLENMLNQKKIRRVKKRWSFKIFLDVIIFNICNVSPRAGALWELDILLGRQNVTRIKQIKG